MIQILVNIYTARKVNFTSRSRQTITFHASKQYKSTHGYNFLTNFSCILFCTQAKNQSFYGFLTFTVVSHHFMPSQQYQSTNRDKAGTRKKINNQNTQKKQLLGILDCDIDERTK